MEYLHRDNKKRIRINFFEMVILVKKLSVNSMV